MREVWLFDDNIGFLSSGFFHCSSLMEEYEKEANQS